MTVTYGAIRASVTDGAQRAESPELRVFLRDQGVFSLTPPRRGMELQVRTGRVWLTQAGDATDYFLNAGEAFQTRDAGRIVIQATGEATLGLSGGGN